MAKNLHTYIMEHDVKAEHIEEYLDDILMIFNTQEENVNTIRYMSRKLEEIIVQMQNGDYRMLEEMRELNANVKSMQCQHQHQDGSSSEGE